MTLTIITTKKKLTRTIMKKILFTIITTILCTSNANAQLSPFDENAPVGWASIGMECTGSNNQNPVTVSTEEELRAALQACKGGKASKTIYISGNIEVKEKLRYDGVKNCTIYGLPGSSLYNRYHNDNADNAGFFFCQKWENCIFRNLTLLGAGAYDISATDNMAFVTSKNIWVDHCDIQDGVDGNLDAKDDADNLTISWCKFAYYIAPWPNSESADHRCSSMWGSSNSRDEEGKLNSTFVNCWWHHGCGQRCPRIRWGSVHIANCLWENGTEDDPAQYCIGVGHGSDMYIENGDFRGTVTSGPHLKEYLTEKKVFNFTVTGCLGETNRQEMGPGCTVAYYNPYNDPNYKCRVYDASLVKEILTNPENGAGATLDEDLLTTRGNLNYGNYTPSAIKGVSDNGEAQVVGIRYYSINGALLDAPQEGVNIIEFQMSDGTKVVNKINK